MSNDLMTLSNNMNVWSDNTQLTEIRKLFAPKVSDLEFKAFVGLGQATGLNPFAREIWCVKYHESSPAQIFIGRDGYRKGAQAHSEYDYHQCDAVYENDKFEIVDGQVKHSYTLTKRGNLVGAYCIAKRHKSSRPIYVFADLGEYSTGKSLWSSKPATMIKKVAESQCLRACFQDLFGGTYGEEEIDSSSQNNKVWNSSANTERLKNTLKETTIIDVQKDNSDVYYSGKDDELASEDQITEIHNILYEKKFTPDRIDKALQYHNVTSFEELTDSKARLFLLQLGKA